MFLDGEHYSPFFIYRHILQLFWANFKDCVIFMGIITKLLMRLNINDEQGIEILHFIFERELKPPFSKGKKDYHDRYPYYNRDGKEIGRLVSPNIFIIMFNPYWDDMAYKICQTFGYDYDTWDPWNDIKPHLKSWLSSKLDINLSHI